MSSLVCNSLRASSGPKMGQSTFKYLSYTLQELKAHLESLWEPRMNWDNYGKGPGRWTIDHVVPQSSFSYTSLEDLAFQECWALSNLQPMEFVENLRKGGRVA